MRGLRALLGSLNLAVTVALLGMLFILINWVASRRYVRADLTRNKIATLSELTVQTLAELKTPVTLTMFYQPSVHGADGSERPVRLYPLILDLLDQYKAKSNKITVELVDPYRDLARAQQLAKLYEVEDVNLLIISAGDRHKRLTDTDLADYDFGTMTATGEPRVKAFKGEEAVTGAILAVTQETAPRLWFITGHGEKTLAGAEGQPPAELADLKKALEQQNMTAEAVTLLERTEIPLDVRLVVIVGPTHRYVDREVDLLDAYLQHGGRLFALLDPMADAGLDGLLSRWGVTLGNNIVVDPARQLQGISPGNLFVATYTDHAIVRKMKTLFTLFPLARSVQPMMPLPQGITASPLALTSPAGWGETQTSAEAFEFNEGQDLKGPVPVAVAAERAGQTRTRLVVFGDSEFVLNGQLNNVGNRDMALGAVNWLLDTESRIAIGPKPLVSMRLNLAGLALAQLQWFSILALPFLSAVAGAGMWWVRRQ